MADMTAEEALAEYGPSEITADDLLTVPDEAFTAENVALVTGAGNGIGRATALALAHNGLTVVATDVDEEGLEEVASKHESLDSPGRLRTAPGDLTDDEEMASVVERAAEEGSLRYLANIAGIQHIASLEAFPMDRYDLMHRIMLRAPLYLSKRCFPHFRDNADGVGAVGNMCSVHGHYVTQDKVAYNTLKFGLRGLTQSIAAEGEGTVRGFSVSTGYVKTELVAKQLPDTADSRGITVAEAVEDVLLGQARVKEMMEPYEVANLFVMGFSEHARFLDGGDVLHDGGMTLTYE
ncbi:SDR family oxidoreductase [Halomarina ordinaria]|uniref:SDR family oxidoreductase n=1 Tax=Halomarina ordinaria TaxID=3033939 RepID=A0ABD5U905_9EURY|nr:SDR family NAD(P)-dependent oxidoreductase [Halomarina sp. PSRA2]